MVRSEHSPTFWPYWPYCRWSLGKIQIGELTSRSKRWFGYIFVGELIVIPTFDALWFIIIHTDVSVTSCFHFETVFFKFFVKLHIPIFLFATKIQTSLTQCLNWSKILKFKLFKHFLKTGEFLFKSHAVHISHTVIFR